MPIDAAQVRRIADLARIELDDEAVELFRHQLRSILDYMALLDELESAGATPAVQEVTVRELREDAPCGCLSVPQTVENAPDHDADRFRVPGMLGTDDD